MAQNLKIGAQNFGPIAQAAVELKPLTIFVGANNTGKSYLAVLIYAMSRALSHGVGSRRPLYVSPRHFAEFELFPRQIPMPYYRLEHVLLTGRALKALRRWLPSDGPSKALGGGTLSIPYQSLPKQVKERINSHVTEYFDSCRASLGREIRRCYGARLGELVCKTTGRKDFCLFVEQDKPELRLQFDLAGQSLKLTRGVFSFRGHTMTGVPRRAFAHARADLGEGGEEGRLDAAATLLAQMMIANSNQEFMDVLARGAYYLPAARSGILQGQKVLSTSLLRLLPLAGIEPIAIPKFSGVVADFLADIGAIDKYERGEFHGLATRLEEELTPGKIEVVVGKYEHPEIYFRMPEVGRIGLHRTSSMISELAPVILFLRYLLRRGNIIIMEEPEAHVHPAYQRKLAKLLVELVRGGVKVILTTHSDYFLQQISNLVALSTKPISRIEDLGFTRQQLVSPEEVGVYLFKSREDGYGSEVSAVEVGEDGIDQQEFDEVAEALYDESVETRRKIRASGRR